MVREILVVKKEVLFKEGDIQGFVPIDEKNFSEIIMNNFEYKERNDELEKNTSFKQIIPYVWFVNPSKKQVYLYKRTPSKNPHIREKRYLNKYSGGLGGHIDKDTEETSENPLITAMMRELREEVEMNNYPRPEFFGYINDDADDLGSVHFGVVAIAETEEEPRSVNEEGINNGKFYSIEEADEVFANPENEFETWTSIGWPFIRKYLIKS